MGPLTGKRVRAVILAPLLAINLVLAAWAAYSLHQGRLQVEARIEAITQNMALALDQSLTSTFRRTDLALLMIADELERQLQTGQGLDPVRINRLIAPITSHVTELSGIRVTDAAGNVLLGTGVGKETRVSYGDREFFAAHQHSTEAKLIVAKPVKGRVEAKWVVPCTRRYNHPDGSFAGVVTAGIDIGYFAKLLSTLNFGARSSAILRDADTGLIARYPPVTGPAGTLGDKSYSKEIAALFATGVPMATYHTPKAADGIERTNSFRRLSIAPMTVIVGLSSDDYLADWHNEVKKVTALLGLLVIASILGGWMIRHLWLQQSRTTEALQAAQEAGHLGTFNLDIATAIWIGSPELDGIFGIGLDHPHDVEGWTRLIHPDDRPGMAAYFKDEVIGRRQAFDREYRVVRPSDGAVRWVHGMGKLELNSTGEPIRLSGAIQDISERRQAIQALAESETRFREIFNTVNDAIFIHDAESGRIIDVNRRMCEMYGLSREEALRAGPNDLSAGTPPYSAAEALAKIQQTFAEGPQVFDWLARSGDGRLFWTEVSLRLANIDSRPRILAVVRDISERKQAEAELDRIAHFDPLTGVPNRRLLQDRLNQALARSRRNGKALAVCYLDLDGFKPVNDQFGHEAGDKLLVEISRRLSDILRAGDTVARLGGDEFVLLFNDLEQTDECFHALDRILASIIAPVQLGHHARVSISASIGVTLFPEDDADSDTLLRHADQAMYLAKEAGKNRFHLFDPAHDRQVKAHRESQQRLAEALARGEFVLHYQPKVNLVTGRVVGVEALIRWQHPERGLLPPLTFLPLLDGTELEIAVGEWVIDAVLQQIMTWQAAGLELAVSANIGAEHLLRKNFAARLQAALQRHPEIPPSALELEIVESAAIGDMEHAVLTLEACLAMGVHFALDDFGTGYSSLSYFRRLPVDTLKIDQSFVRDMLDDLEDFGIVESVIRLAEAFGRPVIAEGVETRQHGEILVKMGCHIAQGYGIARPMPAAEIPAWITRWEQHEAWKDLGTTALRHQDVELTVIAASHRKWLDGVVAHVEQASLSSGATAGLRQCTFGHWYHGSGARRYGHLAEFAALNTAQARIQALAFELETLVEAGRAADAQARLPEFIDLREQVLAGLALMQSRINVSRRDELSPRMSHG